MKTDGADAALLALLFVDGIIVGILSVAFLTPYAGTVPVPIGILIAALGNALLVALSARLAEPPWNWAPVAGWFLVILAAFTGVPGGNVAFVNDWRTPLLIVAGLVAPLAVTGFDGSRRRIEQARQRDIERAARGR
ncbi:MAG: facilitated glucose transporter [Gordonia sp. (in: high G+C Gram-positive bacteria)]|uniref:facilitated glucose transporter n=1 Tax=Gordonia sp. (in: high G+C Gram-positive bacteria) TaxID=84139 RepID=UPI0039E46D1C